MTEETPTSYARAVGEKLRSVRRQQGLALLAVEEASGRSSKRRCWGRMSGAIGSFRYRAYSAWPTCSAFPSTSYCPPTALRRRGTVPWRRSRSVSA